jgi:hypothetical protein
MQADWLCETIPEDDTNHIANGNSSKHFASLHTALFIVII